MIEVFSSICVLAMDADSGKPVEIFSEINSAGLQTSKGQSASVPQNPVIQAGKDRIVVSYLR
jgi:hypothetical protein